jgi:hypothetical protein
MFSSGFILVAILLNLAHRMWFYGCDAARIASAMRAASTAVRTA